jgi:hypothetical protein
LTANCRLPPAATPPASAERHPDGAAVEATRQFLETIADPLARLRQEPALFDRAFLRAAPQRPRQQHDFGFAHPRNYGAWYISQIFDILVSNPNVFSKTGACHVSPARSPKMSSLSAAKMAADPPE